MKRYLRDLAMATGGGFMALLFAGGIVVYAADFSFDGYHVPDDAYYQFGGVNDAATPEVQMGWDNSNSRLRIYDGTNDFWRLADGGTAATITLIDTLHVGVADTTQGDIFAYGGTTGTGGVVRIHNAADADTETDYYELRAASDGAFRLRAEGGTTGALNLLAYDDATKNTEMVSNSGGNTVGFRQGNAAAAAGAEVFYIDNDDANEPFINFIGTTGANATSTISTHNTSGATTDHLQIEINGTKAWIAVSTNDPSA